MSDNKYIKALEVTDFDHQLYTGDNIKIYGEETTITGFSAQYNDALKKWETIIYTVGRGDPFERTLPEIEVLEEQPRSFEQRSSQVFYPQQGAVWVKALKQLPPTPGEYHSKKHGKRFVMLFADADRKMPKEYWEGVEWLDESGQSKEGLAQSRADFIREANGRDLDGVKEREAIDIDELWDEHSELIDDDIDSLSRWAGSTVVDKAKFRAAVAKLWNEWNNQQLKSK